MGAGAYQAKWPRHTHSTRVDQLVVLDLIGRDELLGQGTAASATLFGEHVGLGLQYFDDVGRQAVRLRAVGAGRISLGRGLSVGGRRHFARFRLQRGQRFLGAAHLLAQTGDDPAGGVVLIQCVAQLLASDLQLVAQRERVQHGAVPLVLHDFQQSRYAGGARRSRPHHRLRLHLDQVGHVELLARDRIDGIGQNVFFDEPPLEYGAGRWRYNRLLRNLLGNCKHTSQTNTTKTFQFNNFTSKAALIRVAMGSMRCTFGLEIPENSHITLTKKMAYRINRAYWATDIFDTYSHKPTTFYRD